MFFPALYNAARPTNVELTQEQKAAIYEDGLRPCLTDLNPETLTNWSVNYEGAVTRATKRNNQFQYSTRPFPSDLVYYLGAALTTILADAYPWARDIVYMTQVQGVKEANQHAPDDREQASNTLLHLLDDLDHQLLRERHCWIDVGLELSQPGFVFQWRTDSHHYLISQFTDLTLAQAGRCVERHSRSYAKDYSAGLMHLSGFRASFDLGDGNPVYIQAYTTDKALIYQLDGGRHALSISGAQAMQGPYCMEYMQKIYNIYFDAKDTHDCAARIELRVPADQALIAMPTFGVDLMMRSLCVFDRKDWW
jgi:hypothetical protein